MKKILLIALSVILTVVCFEASAQSKSKKKKADKNTMEWYYEIEAFDVPYRGSSNVKVWSYAADANVARDQATKNAIHGILFRGIPANTAKRISAQPPIVEDFSAEQANKAFFDEFFKDGGEYLRYATKTTSAGNDEILKYGKKNFKVGVVVTVQYDALRKMLEKRGIIKSLTSGFAK